jgi:hypothetical protein
MNLHIFTVKNAKIFWEGLTPSPDPTPRRLRRLAVGCPDFSFLKGGNPTGDIRGIS